ncbi:hypothetical protein N9Y91_08480, partial [Alphaproteobacteria bacterium]|nr:hypothetical protein [Alphaproteobacteria bacterium]
MAVFLIQDSHIQQWDSMLSENPLINNRMENLENYVRFIHEKMTREEKGADLGMSMFIADAVNGSGTDANVYADAKRISAEVNNRMMAHLIYNKEIHQLDFIDPDVAANPAAAVVDMAHDVVASIEMTENTSFTEIGI